MCPRNSRRAGRVVGISLHAPPPSPPRPPAPPPSPPLSGSPSPGSPPPFIKGSVRLRDEDDDGQLYDGQVSGLPQAVKQHAAKNPGYHSTLRISQSPCEGLQSEQSCFVVAAMGARLGESTLLAQRRLHEFRAYNVFRCKFSAHQCASVAIPVCRPPLAPAHTHASSRTAGWWSTLCRGRCLRWSSKRWSGGASRGAHPTRAPWMASP